MGFPPLLLADVLKLCQTGLGKRGIVIKAVQLGFSQNTKNHSGKHFKNSSSAVYLPVLSCSALRTYMFQPSNAQERQTKQALSDFSRKSKYLLELFSTLKTQLFFAIFTQQQNMYDIIQYIQCLTKDTLEEEKITINFGTNFGLWALK